MNHLRLRYLFERYFEKVDTPEERAELARYLGTNAHDEQMMELFTEAWERYQGDGIIITEARADEMINHILRSPENPISGQTGSGDPEATPEGGIIRKLFPWKLFAVAAAVVVLLLGGYRVWTLLYGKDSGTVPIAKAAHDVKPGTFRASLTLANGQKIILDSAGLGQLAQQGNTKIIKSNGKLVYQAGTGKPGEDLFNTVATNKGETFSLALPDGSQVWLNSGSSIRFPVAFTGAERRISITGEVYVKVAANPDQPFIASATGIDVRALGTEFDINAYTDEERVNTTLVQGSVKVSGGSADEILKPGQQTGLGANGKLSKPQSVELDDVIAWKEGLFQFENADIKTILRAFARWYDIEVIYQGPVSESKFFCIVNRNTSLANVLQMLNQNEITFKIDGKKLYVSQEKGQ